MRHRSPSYFYKLILYTIATILVTIVRELKAVILVVHTIISNIGISTLFS